MQEAVGVFTGFRDKVFRTADANISLNGRHNSSDTDGWIRFRLQKNLTHHGGGGSLSMGA